MSVLCEVSWALRYMLTTRQHGCDLKVLVHLVFWIDLLMIETALIYPHPSIVKFIQGRVKMEYAEID